MIFWFACSVISAFWYYNNNKEVDYVALIMMFLMGPLGLIVLTINSIAKGKD